MRARKVALSRTVSARQPPSHVWAAHRVLVRLSRSHTATAIVARTSHPRYTEDRIAPADDSRNAHQERKGLE